MHSYLSAIENPVFKLAPRKSWLFCAAASLATASLLAGENGVSSAQTGKRFNLSPQNIVIFSQPLPTAFVQPVAGFAMQSEDQPSGVNADATPAGEEAAGAKASDGDVEAKAGDEPTEETTAAADEDSSSDDANLGTPVHAKPARLMLAGHKKPRRIPANAKAKRIPLTDPPAVTPKAVEESKEEEEPPKKLEWEKPVATPNGDRGITLKLSDDSADAENVPLEEPVDGDDSPYRQFELELMPSRSPDNDRAGAAPIELEVEEEKPEPELRLHAPDSSEDKECPGAPDGTEVAVPAQPDDVPLEQEPHPYDAPAARATEPQDSQTTVEANFTARELAIHQKINQTLHYFLTHPENVVRRGPWALMHATLPFGVETDIIAGNRKANAIGWMCYNGVCARQRMFQPTRTGFRTNVGPGMQGHEGQFLAILAQSRVQSDYPIKIGNRSYSIKDLVRYEMATCREKSELTFKLIGLSYYLDANQTWRDNRGHQWTMEKMVADELSQPINGVACGGTHRLMGLSYAIIERQRAGLPITGVWARAEQYLNEYINYTMTLQNPDGSFSTNWFEGRGNKNDTERKVQTTGHMLEWLIYTLPDEHLRSPRIQVSLEYLLNTVGRNPGYDWPIGPRGHALRAMALYNQRVFGVEQGQVADYVAGQLRTTHSGIRR